MGRGEGASGPGPELEILAAGHYCHDTIIDREGKVTRTLGGSVSYLSAVLDGFGARYGIVAKVGEDFLYFDRVSRAPLRRPRLVREAATTAFRADFRGGERVGSIEAACEPILAEDLPATRVRVAVACGIAGEITPGCLARMREIADLVLCDAQALIREAGPDGRVAHRRLEETPFAELVDGIHFLKASQAEAEFLDLPALRRRTTVLVTEGPAGCRILDEKSERRVPAPRVTEIDPTGAGDCFVAGLAFALCRGFGVEEAVRVGNRCGAAAVTQVGVPRFRELTLPPLLMADSAG
jgi:1D-myo-inositol 3-kinase